LFVRNVYIRAGSELSACNCRHASVRFALSTSCIIIKIRTYSPSVYHKLLLQGTSIACISYDRVVRLSVCLSVCPSHAGTESERCKLGSQNFHRWIATDSSFPDKKFVQKFERVHPELGREMRVW